MTSQESSSLHSHCQVTLISFPLVFSEVFQGCCFLPATSPDLELLDLTFDVSSHEAMPLNPQRHTFYFPVHAFVTVSVVKC